MGRTITLAMPDVLQDVEVISRKTELSVELVKSALEALGYELEIRNFPWKRIQKMVAKGEQNGALPVLFKHKRG